MFNTVFVCVCLFSFYNFRLMLRFMLDFQKIIAPGGGVLEQFLRPNGRGFALSLCSGGGGNWPFQKIPWGLPRGGWSGLELTDT